ncbi:tryptophan synthase subunit alpha [Pseudonocardia sp. CNS-139]|nr:tryptophan synthase subunit alpha [Pseudonocardia sp. CNS-139]
MTAGLADRFKHVGTHIGLVPYLMAGHPDGRTTREVGRRLAASGAAAVEIGIPHGDPLADGPVIRRAGEQALRAGTTVARALELAADVAGEGAAPVVLMTYVNPVLAYGPQRFADHAAEAGVAAVIVPDLPVEESGPVATPLRAAGVETVFLVGPGSPDERIALAAGASTGFLYCATSPGSPAPAPRCPPTSPGSSRGSGATPACRWRPDSGSPDPSTWRACAGTPTWPSSAARSSPRSTAATTPSTW